MELEAGPVHLHANTQNAFPPHTPLLLMEALSLEPWKVWNTYFAPSLQLWELPARAHGACSPELQVGLPSGGLQSLPSRLTSMSNPRAAASSGQLGTKRPGLAAGPIAGAFGKSLGMLPASRGQKALPKPSTLTFLGVAGVRADPSVRPPPSPLLLPP